MGWSHAKEFRDHPNAQLVAVADVDKQRIEERARELDPTNRYGSAEDMLENESLDAVCVATPNKFHKPLTIAALEAGCHVLCEKPMALNGREARQMLDAARKADKRLMINFSFRFTPQSCALKKQVDDGLLGDIYFAETIWLRRRGVPMRPSFVQREISGGGPLIDLGVHRLDLALWLMGYPKPVWVMGKTYDHLSPKRLKQADFPYDVEDMAAAFVTFENGACLQLQASWESHIKERELMVTRLLGTKGGLVQRNLEETYKFQAETFFDRDGVQCNMIPHESIPAPANAVAHFVDCIVQDKPHTATGEEGLIVMKLLDAIYESSKKGTPMKVASCEQH